MDRLLEASEYHGDGALARFRVQYERMIEEALARRELARQALWTESLAVGEQTWARQVGRLIRNRMAVELACSDQSIWTVREHPSTYSTE